jgi:tetratricopeptide (TPR) repeat protein
MLAYWAAVAGDEAAADSLSLRFIELEPDQANPYDSRGEILERLGRNEEARAMFREAIRRDPNLIMPYEHLSRSYLWEGDAAGARTALQPFLTGDDPDIAVWTQMLVKDTYAFEGRYLDALAAERSAFEKASELGADDRGALEGVGRWANATGAYDDAEEIYVELYSLDPHNRAILFGILTTFGKQGRFEEMSRVRHAAAADIDAAPESMRGRVESLVYFADGLIAWHRDGDAEETVRLFGEARAARGMSKTVRLGRDYQGEEVLALIEVGRASDAMAIIDNLEGFGMASTSPMLVHTAWYLRGRAYEALGETDKALESYQQLLDVAGDGVREVVLFRDTPERVARLRGGG